MTTTLPSTTGENLTPGQVDAGAERLLDALTLRQPQPPTAEILARIDEVLAIGPTGRRDQ